MRNHKTLLSLAIVALFAIGCATQSRFTYNTLAGVESATTGAFDAYLNLVVGGHIPTNSLPVISRDYNLFKLSWSAAVAIAQWNTNAVATQPVLDAAAIVINDISNAKGSK